MTMQALEDILCRYRGRLSAPVFACASGSMPANVALMHLIVEARARDELEGLFGTLTRWCQAEPAAEAGRMRRLLHFWESEPQAWDTIRSVIVGVEHDLPPGIDQDWGSLFDRAAAASPEGSVALYALGSPALLRQATDEVVALMRGWELLGPERDVLEIGCGIGRFAVALAPHVGRFLGLDISAAMIAEAERRTHGFANVSLHQSSGHDLAEIADASIDLVLAADVFPYLYLAGAGAVERHIAEIARVLKPGGAALLFNLSYREGLEEDQADLARLAGQHGLTIQRNGTRDLTLWDAAAFLLRKG